jgi:hypothetical protein
MGIKLWKNSYSSSPDYTCEQLRCHFFDNLALVKLRYRDAKNFDGEKILLVKQYMLLPGKKHYKIDPHFHTSKHVVARFHPDLWETALKASQIIDRDFDN